VNISKLIQKFRAEFTAKIIGVVSSGLLTVILARLLDPDSYGLLFLAISVFGIAQLFSQLGVAKSAARYISNYKETSPGQLPHIIKFSVLLNLLILVPVGIAFLIWHGKIAELIGQPDLSPLLLLGSLYLAFHTSYTFCRIMMQGFESIKASAAMSVINEITCFLFAVCLVLLGYGALGALGGYVIGFMIATIFGTIYLYFRQYKKLEQVQREPGLYRRITEYMIPLTATGTANVLDKRVDMILLGFFTTPTAVAFYTIGKQVVTFVETPMSALGFTLAPTYEAEKAKGNADTAARIYEEALSHGLLLYIPAAAGIILVAEPVIEIFFGNDYLGAVPVLQILAIYAVLQAVTKLTSDGLNYLGRARARAIVKAITSVLNVILNLLLIPTMGVIGAAFSTVITYSVYTFANFYIMSTELDIRLLWLSRYVCIVSIITGIMSAVVYIVVGLITGFISLLVVVLLGIIIWLILSVGLSLIDIKRMISIVS